MKTSLILTLFNEGEYIEALLGSIKDQTERPDEVIIVDGGSSDNTVPDVRHFQSINPEIHLKLIIQEGCNIPQGRNAAIRRARTNTILVTDGGCVLTHDWVKEITLPLLDRPEIDVVGGTYEALPKTYLQRCMAKILVPSESESNGRRFIPSSRSVAFRKRVWDEIGGYPEELDFAEDTAFMRSLMDGQRTMVIAGNAKVLWSQRKSVVQFVRQVFLYAKWDMLAGNFSRALARSSCNTGLLLISLVQFQLFPIYAISLLYSVWRLRRRFGRNDLHLLPGVLCLRILEEKSRAAGYLIGWWCAWNRKN